MRKDKNGTRKITTEKLSLSARMELPKSCLNGINEEGIRNEL